MLTKEKIHDPFLRSTKDFPQRPGLSPLELASRSGGPSLLKYFDGSVPKKFEDFPRDREEILAKGACLGFDDKGITRHMRPGLRSFAGFLEGHYDNGKVCVVTRGIVTLNIPGLSQDSRGKEVFSTGPNDFNLSGEGLKIGTVLYTEKIGRVAVLFQGITDTKKAVINWRDLGVSFK